jgi:hypothetical protein
LHPDRQERQRIGQARSALRQSHGVVARATGMIETWAKQTFRTMGSQLGRQIVRRALGGIFGGRR